MLFPALSRSNLGRCRKRRPKNIRMTAMSQWLRDHPKIGWHLEPFAHTARQRLALQNGVEERNRTSLAAPGKWSVMAWVLALEWGRKTTRFPLQRCSTPCADKFLD